MTARYARHMVPALAAGSLAAIALTGCGAAASAARPGAGPVHTTTMSSTPPPPVTPTPPARPSRRASSAARAVNHLTAIARSRYAEEMHGGLVHRQLRRLARDAALRRAVAAGDSATRAYVASKFMTVWYHWHVSRLVILRGSRTVVDAGVPFVVGPAKLTLRDAHGRYLATLFASDQDVIGFVRFMRRNYGVDVVVRGTGPGHVRTSLPAALGVDLPASGTVSIAGLRYLVRSFGVRALAGEPLTVWILHRG